MITRWERAGLLLLCCDRLVLLASVVVGLFIGATGWALSVAWIGGLLAVIRADKAISWTMALKRGGRL